MSIKIKKYDVIIMHKVHSNKIFKRLNKNLKVKITSKKNINGNFESNFVKSRPVIVLSKLVEYKSGNCILLVAPLTTKTENKTISKWFRSDFNALDKKSYIMWDAVQRINSTEVKSLYSKNGQILNLSGATKEYIKKEGEKKIFNWVNLKK